MWKLARRVRLQLLAGILFFFFFSSLSLKLAALYIMRCWEHKGLNMLWCCCTLGMCVCMLCVSKGLSLTGEQWLYNVSRLGGMEQGAGREQTDPGELTPAFSQPLAGAAGIIC